MTESCFEFGECAAYAAVVLDLEYADELGKDGFADACGDPDRPAVIILRDHGSAMPGGGEYVYRSRG